MGWQDETFGSVVASLDAERSALRRLGPARTSDDERLGLYWLPEGAFGHVVWKGLAGRFGPDAVRRDVSAVAFDGERSRCDLVVDVGGEWLWLQVKHQVRVRGARRRRLERLALVEREEVLRRHRVRHLALVAPSEQRRRAAGLSPPRAVAGDVLGPRPLETPAVGERRGARGRPHRPPAHIPGGPAVVVVPTLQRAPTRLRAGRRRGGEPWPGRVPAGRPADPAGHGTCTRK